MSHTVKANTRAVCTKGTGDEALAEVDECKTPDGETVEPPNVAYTKDLASGETTSVFIQQQPVWNKKGKLDGGPSDPDHDGSDGGVNSGTFRGWCAPTSASPDWTRRRRCACGSTTSTRNSATRWRISGFPTSRRNDSSR